MNDSKLWVSYENLSSNSNNVNVQTPRDVVMYPIIIAIPLIRTFEHRKMSNSFF